MKLIKEDLPVDIFKQIKGVFNIFCPSEAMADLFNLQGKMELPILIEYVFY